MTLVERVQSIAAIGKSVWYLALVIGLVVAFALVARSCNRANEAKAALVKFQDEASAQLAGLEVVRDAEKSALKDELATAKKESAAFAQELKKAQDALKARPVMVVRAKTGPVPVEPVIEPKEDPVPVQEPKQDAPAECVLYRGDMGEVAVTQAVLQTDSGARVLVGAAAAYRVTPLPRMRLFEGTFRTEVTEALAEPIRLRDGPGWGFGLVGGIGLEGVVASAVALSPPLLGDHFSAAGVVTAGPRYGALQAGFIWR